MKLLLVNDIDTLKSTDNATQVELAVLDEEQQRIDLSQFTTIAVQIGSNGSLYSTETPIVNEEMNTFSFTLSSELPAGTYSIQVNLTTADNKLHIAPNSGTQRLLIEKSFNEVGETIPVISIKSLLDDMAATLVIAKDAKTVADEAKSQVMQAVEASENAVSQVEGAVASANQAVQSSTDAVAVANQAKNEAQTASAMSSEAMTQADSAKALSTQATTDAAKAKTDASTALSTANSAKSTVESVESRFNELTAGNTNDEVIQSRTDEENTAHATLKARLDHEATARKNADAQTLVDAKSYTDTKVGNVDLSALATKTELTDGLSTKVNTVEGKGLSANDYTDADKSKLWGIANGANNYTLPVATSGILGGVKIANNAGLEITGGGTLSATTLKSSVDNHIADSAKHITTSERTKFNTVGTVANLKTTVKTDVVSAINELFQNVSDGKSSLATAITAKGQNITGDSTFAEMVSAIGNIATGKKSATGLTTAVTGRHTTDVGSFPFSVIVKGLDFNPSLVYIRIEKTGYTAYFTLYAKVGIIGTTGRFFYSSDGPFDFKSTEATFENGFNMPAKYDVPYRWYAYE